MVGGGRLVGRVLFEEAGDAEEQEEGSGEGGRGADALLASSGGADALGEVRGEGGMGGLIGEVEKL